MKRIDRLIGEARLHRIRRAAKARGIPVGDGPADWIEESDAARAILLDLDEPVVEGGPADRRRREPIGVLDPAILSTFIDRCVGAIEEVVKELDPVGLVLDDAHPKVCALVHASCIEGSTSSDGRDAGRARRAAVRDVSVLAVELAMLEVVRRLHLANDLDRVIVASSDPSTIVVRDGRLRRKRKPKVEAARANAARLFGASRSDAGTSDPETGGASS